MPAIQRYRGLLAIAVAFTVVPVNAQNYDVDILRIIYSHRVTAFDYILIAITNSVTPLSYVLPLLLLLYSVLVKNLAIRDRTVYIAISAITAALTSTLLKNYFSRTRPYETYLFIHNTLDIATASFPSGHTSAAIALATSLSLAFQNRWIITISYSWAVLVAYSRLAFGVHYPTDVLGGAVLGLVVPLAFFFFMKPNERPVEIKSET